MKPSTSFNDLILKLSFSLVIPTIILNNSKLNSVLASYYVFGLAIFFPLMLAVSELIKNKKVSLFSIIGFLNIVLSIIILSLDYSKIVYAIKEASFPLILLLLLLFARTSKYDFLTKIIVAPIKKELLLTLDEKAEYKRILNLTYYGISLLFFYSTVMNFILSFLVLKSNFGTPSFNQELAKLTIQNLVFINVPICLGILFFEFNYIKKVSKLAGITIKETLNKGR